MHHDVIIIGGGVTGASCALELAKEGLDVLLIEKRHIASGASGSSAAMLECQIDAHRGEPFFSLARQSQKMYPHLEEEIKELTGEGFDLELAGIIQLAQTAEDADFLKKESARQKKLGLKAEWLNPEEVEKRFPQINPDYFGGSFFAEDGQVNGERLNASLVKAAEIKGTCIKEEVGDWAFNLKDGRVIGVMTSTENITADWFVVAAGAWTDQVLSQFDLQLGIAPIRGQLLVYDTPKRPIECPIYTRSGGYITPKKNGFTLVGTTVEKVGFDESTTPEAREQLAQTARKFLPGLARSPIRGMIAGLRPGSPDNMPVIGPIPGHENVIVAAGHYRNGMMLAPITGLLVKSLIMKISPPLSLAPFLPDRFISK